METAEAGSRRFPGQMDDAGRGAERKGTADREGAGRGALDSERIRGCTWQVQPPDSLAPVTPPGSEGAGPVGVLSRRRAHRHVWPSRPWPFPRAPRSGAPNAAPRCRRQTVPLPEANPASAGTGPPLSRSVRAWLSSSAAALGGLLGAGRHLLGHHVHLLHLRVDLGDHGGLVLHRGGNLRCHRRHTLHLWSSICSRERITSPLSCTPFSAALHTALDEGGGVSSRPRRSGWPAPAPPPPPPRSPVRHRRPGPTPTAAFSASRFVGRRSPRFVFHDLRRLGARPAGCRGPASVSRVIREAPSLGCAPGSWRPGLGPPPRWRRSAGSWRRTAGPWRPPTPGWWPESLAAVGQHLVSPEVISEPAWDTCSAAASTRANWVERFSTALLNVP